MGNRVVTVSGQQRRVIVPYEHGVMRDLKQPLNLAQLNALKRRIADNWASTFQGKYAEEVRTAPDQFMMMVERGLGKFATYHIEGHENLPKRGRWIIAPNHPLPFQEFLVVMKAIHQLLPQMPFKIIMNINLLTKAFPKWRSYSSFLKRIIPVYREQRDTYGDVVNTTKIFSESVKFLRSQQDAILIVAPEGPDSIMQDWVLNADSGFATIAKAAKASILPVKVTGEANLDDLLFQVEIEFLSPLRLTLPAQMRETTMLWELSMMRAFGVTNR